MIPFCCAGFGPRLLPKLGTMVMTQRTVPIAAAVARCTVFLHTRTLEGVKDSLIQGTAMVRQKVIKITFFE